MRINSKKLEVIFDYDKNLERIKDLELEINKEDFWKGADKDKVLSDLKYLKSQTNLYTELIDKFNEIKELAGIVDESDNNSISHLREEFSLLTKKILDLEFKSILNKPEDRCNAIMSINAGAGGTESCDWVAMLARMYAKWAESNGYKIDTTDILLGEDAGIKNITIMIKGDFAYGYLKSEIGVHRLVRISPFDANKRRHTSFASVDVLPEIDDEIKIDIKESDLRVDTYRSSGAGGQHVNVTDSAVRITHVPTNIVVQCQNERSQGKNKATALKILRSKLYEKEMAKRKDELSKGYQEKSEIAWGSQIRSYVFQPYTLVKDHRTGFETSNGTAVMNGDINEFLESYLKMTAKK